MTMILINCAALADSFADR